MKFFTLETFKLGVNNLRRHKLRSLLTSLGIIFGVAAVICMLSITEGASADEMRLIELLGTKNIIVTSTKPTTTKVVSQGQSNLVQYGITHADLDSIRATIPHLTHIVPLKTVAYRARRGQQQASLNVVATAPDFFEVVNIRVARGRALTNTDMTERTNVCIIGDQVRKELFPFEDPLGESVLVERYPSAVPFEVVGILEEVKTAGAPARGVEERNLNREILIPLATGMSQFGEITRRADSGSRELIKMQYSGLYLAVDEIDNVLTVSKTVEQVFAHRRDNTIDYDIRVPLRGLELAKKKKRNNQLTLGFIAGVSLLVGGIGIMNIMLATVTERTREIGIRRALGAKQKHIAVQFLIETVVLSTCGGLVGVGLGIVGAHIVSQWAEWNAIVSTWSVAVSFGLSVLVGIFFGMYPALSAAELDPIEALRYD